jgi:hypothetical protein
MNIRTPRGRLREILATAGSFRMLAPPASVWVIHEDADRSRPFHADYGTASKIRLGRSDARSHLRGRASTLLGSTHAFRLNATVPCWRPSGRPAWPARGSPTWRTTCRCGGSSKAGRFGGWSPSCRWGRHGWSARWTGSRSPNHGAVALSYTTSRDATGTTRRAGSTNRSGTSGYKRCSGIADQRPLRHDAQYEGGRPRTAGSNWSRYV